MIGFLGEQAYAAYRQKLLEVPIVQSGFVRPPQEWGELEPAVQQAWQSAAEEIVSHCGVSPRAFDGVKG